MVSQSALSQVVTDVTDYQEGNNIVVTYLLEGDATIQLYYSTDGGRSFKGPLSRVSGDVGPSVIPGQNEIVWDVLSEVESLDSPQVVFKVVAIGNGRAVNMGLSVDWAASNLGAASPYECGNYYAWGETNTKNRFERSNYKYGKGDFDVLLKYNTNEAFGYVDRLTQLQLSDDAARKYLGGGWRMPTSREWKELIDNCRWTWTQRNGSSGYLVVSRITGAEIFIPIGGYYEGDTNYNKNKNGFYWSSSLQAGYPSAAEYLEFEAESDYNPCSIEATFRSYGLLIRPVRDKSYSY